VDCCKCANNKFCKCECSCFGVFTHSPWRAQNLTNVNIKILYRENIKVFYPTVTAAKNDGYTEFNPKVFTKQNGYVYSFSGLRGNAKTLYR
jgi:hypothetical protein